MQDLLKKNKLVILVAVIVVCGVVWYSFLGGDTTTQNVLTSQTADSLPAIKDREALDILLQLRAIQLNGNIFNDPSFQSLSDTRTEIVPEPVGKRNPFAPFIGSTTSPADAKAR